MPTIHREHGPRFVIFVDDHPPPHVHVTGHGVAKVQPEPAVELISSRGFSAPDVRRALDVVSARREVMLRDWKRIHG